MLEAFSLAAYSNSQIHYAKGTLSDIANKFAIVLQPLVSVWFQVLFHSLT